MSVRIFVPKTKQENGLLYRTMHKGEQIQVGSALVTISNLSAGVVELAIEAPTDVVIDRTIKRERR